MFPRVFVRYIEPGSQWENGYCECFNGKLRDECLNGEIFYSLKEAQVVIEKWRVDQLLTMTFGLVAVSIVVQGITMKPLIRLLGIGKNNEDDYSRARVRQAAVTSALSELESMANRHLVSRGVGATSP